MKPHRQRAVAGAAAFDRRQERRDLKHEAHVAFDRLWKDGHMSRAEAYRWLASELEMPARRAHFGRLNRADLRIVLESVKAYLYAREAA